MREIEFRAWLKDEKKMVKVKAIDWVEEIDIFSINYPEGKSYSGYDRDNIELMQYIGLKDKNGVKIFEGDIVRYDELIGPVLWSKDLVWCTDLGGYGEEMITAYLDYGLEVIGNIYENKELLNG